ncbi:hypothetical protein [Chryseobacterium paridis]|uniref:Lipoprotein n=1 Tax=Chryseobacterium paridis TaxID=2800328 RepID=A0ABS1FUT3_9FLAO|nr:hypothetical protein [Chryseobacterium paridis]MBK1896186.1 hypothetical protein [Chryseobacterium paridis]
MHHTIKNVILMGTFLTITACEFSRNTPTEYFDRVALNTNQITRFGGQYFNTYLKYIKGGASTPDFNTCEKYLKNNSIATAERNVQKIKELQSTPKTKPMIDAALDLYAFVLNSYKTDHLKIAKMIDNKAPEADIEAAIIEMDNKSYDIFAQKYDNLWKLAEIYAKDNGIEVKKMPF